MMVHSLYIHIPFCLRKCPYCDFCSVPYDEEPARRTIAAVMRELEMRSRDACELSTVYIGGGTPTIVPASELIRLIGSVRDYYRVAPDAEITVEANPGTVTKDSVRALAGAGINRFSLGVQSFDDGELKALGRIYGSGDVLRAVDAVRGAGIRNLSLDLMYGIPGQTRDAWSAHIGKAIGLGPEHISTYELTVEPGTPLEVAVSKGRTEKPGDDTIVAMYENVIDRLTAAGYRHYEISNFAKPGFGCRHNINYWNRGEYIGAGAGAHSFINGRRIRNFSRIDRYNEALEHGRLPVEEETETGRVDAIKEFIMLGLRKTGGVDLRLCRAEFGFDLAGSCATMIGQGLMTTGDGFIRLTRKGIILSNSVIAELFRAAEKT